MRTPYQKEKLLKILELLLHETDENHPMNASEISNRLRSDLGEEYVVDRKSVGSDVQACVNVGYDIVQKQGRKGGYYCASREFDLPEVKILADAVSASRFITEKKARELLKKLEALTNRFEANSLKRQIVVQNRTKTDNEKIYYIVDALSQAIEAGKPVAFQYSTYNIEKTRVPRHGGRIYVVSPAFLLWDNENYYLVAYDHKEEEIRHYRVDRMMKAEVLDEPMQGAKERKALRRDDYAKRTFGMFAGETREVRLEFDERMVDVILDRFGLDTRMHYVKADKKEELDRGSVDSGVQEAPRRVQAVVEVEVSQQFFGWITGLGPHISIVGPLDVRTSYMEQLERTLGNYR